MQKLPELNTQHHTSHKSAAGNQDNTTDTRTVLWPAEN